MPVVKHNCTFLFYVVFFFAALFLFSNTGHSKYNNNPPATITALELAGFAPVILQVCSVGRLLSSTAGCTLVP
jgi:hypothetical protein